jgi:hypothetical protein
MQNQSVGAHFIGVAIITPVRRNDRANPPL